MKRFDIFASKRLIIIFINLSIKSRSMKFPATKNHNIYFILNTNLITLEINSCFNKKMKLCALHLIIPKGDFCIESTNYIILFFKLHSK